MDTRVFQTSYGAIHARVQGQGPTVIFVPGQVPPLDTWQCWAANLAEVAAAGFRTVALDLPGFGEAARPDGPISTESAVDCVLELFDRWPLRQAYIVGHNWGGLLAWRAGIIGGRRVEKLVLVAAEGAQQLSQSLSGDLSVPTLIIWAEDDPYLPVTDADLFANAIPNSRKHIFPGLGDSGGQPVLNHPQAPQLAGKVFNDVLVKFLKE